MSTGQVKRKRADNSDAGDHGRSHKQQKPFSKRLRPNQKPGSKHPPKSGEEEEAQKSINALKGRIRDLTRTLRRVDNDSKHRMPQGIRIERERELESCKHELEEREIAKRETKFRNGIIGKYHMVRFFGRPTCSQT